MSKFNEFLDYIDPSLSQSSRLVVRRCLWSLRRGLAGQEPSSQNILTWLKQRLSVDKVSAATLRLERTYANRFFEWAVSMRYMEDNPLKPIPGVPVSIINKQSVTPEQFAAIKRAGEGTFWPYLCTIAWITGARSIDVVSLQWGNVDFDNKKLRFLPVKTKISGRWVEIPLNDELLQLFSDWYSVRAAGATLICPEAKVIHSRNDGSFQRQFRTVCERAGVPKDVTFHSFRHSRARRMLTGENKVSPLVAADVLGISSLTTLRRYAQSSDEEKQKAINL